MILQRLFAPRPAKVSGAALYRSAAAQARRPAFYRGLGAADTPDGRFELYCLHVALLLMRLKGQGPAAAETAQALFDAFVRSLDDALRELGVGDLTVPKRMKTMGQAFYGRARAYDDALAALPDTTELDALLARTAGAEMDAPSQARLSAYVVGAAAALNAQPLGDLLEGRAAWPEAPE